MKNLKSKILNLKLLFCKLLTAYCSLLTAFCLLLTVNSFATVKNQRSASVYPTIQAAVDAAINGDKLLVSTGLYLESVSITNKFIELEGGYISPAFSSRTNDFSSTIIGTNIVGAVVNISSSGGALLDTFTITGGNLQLWPPINGSGVLIDYDCICTMKNCQVKGNYAYYGGGISAWSNSTLFVDNCLIHHNESWFGGGGIAGYIDSKITLTNKTECILNFSSVGGGIAANSKNLTINGAAIVVENIAISKGGGIYLENCGLCNIFGENTSIGDAFDENQVTNGCGGGIYAVNSSIIISGKNCRVNGGVASDSGGGIYLDNSYLQLLDEAELGRADMFSVSIANTNGGCLWMNSSTFIASGGAKVLMGDALVGGGICADSSYISFSNAVLGCEDKRFGNHASWGGGINSINSVILFKDSFILGNYAEEMGGGINVGGTGSNIFINTRIANNISKKSAGAISSPVTSGTFLFENSQIISNSALQYGAMMLALANTTFINCKINYNSAQDKFGGMAMVNGSLLLQNTEISHNSSSGVFSGVVVSDCPTICEDCVFDSNVSLTNTEMNNAGALYASRCDVIIRAVSNRCLFSDNSASGGGAIMIENGRLDIIFPEGAHRCMFSGNRAVGYGGAILLDNNATSTIAGNVVFVSNRAENGGAIASVTNAQILVDSTNDIGVSMINNFAKVNGGALYVSGLSSLVELVEVDFDGNQAFGWSSGGNSGGGGGGAAIMNKASLHALNCVFNKNISSNSLINGGSAILVDNSFIDIRGDKPQNNFMPGSQIINNIGGKAIGGAVSIISGSDAYISDTIIASNSAELGGGIYIFNSKCKFVNSIVAKNSANLGDGIYMGGAFLNAELILQNSDIVDNYGFGVYLDYGTTTVQNCVLWGNSNQFHDGGGYYLTTMFSNVEGGYIGISNINANPLFADSAIMNYQLTEASPCLNIGMIIPSITNDCIGETRPQLGGYDMGAYEFIPEPGAFGAVISYLLLVIGIGRKFISSL